MGRAEEVVERVANAIDLAGPEYRNLAIPQRVRPGKFTAYRAISALVTELGITEEMVERLTAMADALTGDGYGLVADSDLKPPAAALSTLLEIAEP